MQVHLIRTQKTNQITTGIMSFYDEDKKPMFSLVTLERPWINNKKGISCIPPGLYLVTKRFSLKHGHHFLINKVKDRSLILIHIGNYVTETKGCILVGMQGIKNASGSYVSLFESGKALQLMDNECTMSFELLIE